MLVLVLVIVLEKLSKPYLVLDGGIDCQKTDGPTKQVERRGRTKSGPIEPMRFEDEHQHDDEDELVAALPRFCTPVVNPASQESRNALN